VNLGLVGSDISEKCPGILGTGVAVPALTNLKAWLHRIAAI
tara:strand:+ start:5958 stop:6080 length:123 start_codon:yes stop_codon:yes gene_type:complete